MTILFPVGIEVFRKAKSTKNLEWIGTDGSRYGELDDTRKQDLRQLQ